MPTVFTHAISAVGLGMAMLPANSGARVWLTGAACAMLPDLDVLAFRFGVPYSDMLGHRGLSHSVPFAIVLSAVVTWLVFAAQPWRGKRLRIGLFVLVATVSHGVLDAFTNGGLGIAFAAPFSAERFFFPVRPIEVSPIGSAFFSARGWRVLESEIVWVWLPSAALALTGLTLRYRRRTSDVY